MTSLVFRAPNRHRLGLTAEVLDVLLAYRQTAADLPEAGGVMLGRFMREGGDVIVDRVTGPLPGDRRSRKRFFRSEAPHQAVVTAEWEASGGIRTYIGEWHTHPEPFPTPSGTDLRDWRRRLRRDVFHGDVLRFVIVGQEEVGAWMLPRGATAPLKLEQETNE
ncbi:Mov34/MPN/PAD-1 family protein [Deinococcus budaensis]|uniref:Integrative and conjugative element protein (TIGR02256 family) n=1 Tax=Deinococcus budaensis TaxID=1665626 RepID=A0A7W8LNR2_9DEIO|nr:Mov34/MPN/PAD-1 family protein [Deinococcus budaensis]MBB5232971.1 integrative and conjugative element protein (TIGR02256 family) [Deinococcus budaensis]